MCRTCRTVGQRPSGIQFCSVQFKSDSYFVSPCRRNSWRQPRIPLPSVFAKEKVACCSNQHLQKGSYPRSFPPRESFRKERQRLGSLAAGARSSSQPIRRPSGGDCRFRVRQFCHLFRGRYASRPDPKAEAKPPRQGRGLETGRHRRSPGGTRQRRHGAQHPFSV